MGQGEGRTLNGYIHATALPLTTTTIMLVPVPINYKTLYMSYREVTKMMVLVVEGTQTSGLQLTDEQAVQYFRENLAIDDKFHSNWLGSQLLPLLVADVIKGAGLAKATVDTISVPRNARVLFLLHDSSEDPGLQGPVPQLGFLRLPRCKVTHESRTLPCTRMPTVRKLKPLFVTAAFHRQLKSSSRSCALPQAD